MDKNNSPIPYIVTYEGIESANLVPEEAFVFTRVNGRESLYQIAKTLGYTEDKVYQLLMKSMDKGFVAFREDTANYRIQEFESPESRFKSKAPQDLQSQTAEKDQRVVRVEKFLQKYDGENTNKIFAEQLESIKVLTKSYAYWVKQFHPDQLDEHDPSGLRNSYNEALLRVNKAYACAKTSLKEKSPQMPLTKQDKDISVDSKKNLGSEDSAKRYYEMGQKEEHAGEFSAAKGFYQMALGNMPKEDLYIQSLEKIQTKLDRGKIKGWLKAAQKCLEQNNLENAAEIYEKILATDLTQKDCYTELAIIYSGNIEKIDRAREMGEIAREFFPNDSRILMTLAKIYLRKSDYKKSARSAELARNAAPENEDIAKAYTQIMNIVRDQ